MEEKIVDGRALAIVRDANPRLSFEDARETNDREKVVGINTAAGAAVDAIVEDTAGLTDGESSLCFITKERITDIILFACFGKASNTALIPVGK
eukprot:m.105012 g.105012  ORF g.105012 m.105012 type:complete len:94 (+) comp9121_c6_seq1:773-1054(+)